MNKEFIITLILSHLAFGIVCYSYGVHRGEIKQWKLMSREINKIINIMNGQLKGLDRIERRIKEYIKRGGVDYPRERD